MNMSENESSNTLAPGSLPLFSFHSCLLPFSTPLHRTCAAAAAAAKSLQSCPILCDPIDSSPPGSPIPGIPQERTLEWAAVAFSSAGKWKVKVKSLSRVWLFSDPMDCSPPGSSVHGIFQARVLEWGAIVSTPSISLHGYVSLPPISKFLGPSWSRQVPLGLTFCPDALMVSLGFRFTNKESQTFLRNEAPTKYPIYRYTLS